MPEAISMRRFGVNPWRKVMTMQRRGRQLENGWLADEAVAIVEGRSDRPATVAHLRALLELLVALRAAHEERLEVMRALVEAAHHGMVAN